MLKVKNYGSPFAREQFLGLERGGNIQTVLDISSHLINISF
jgi:hypothetical protein